MNNCKQKGFTIVELVVSLFALAGLGCVIALIWAICHFVAKFW